MQSMHTAKLTLTNSHHSLSFYWTVLEMATGQLCSEHSCAVHFQLFAMVLNRVT